MAIEFIRILLGSIVAIEARPFQEFFFNWQLPRVGRINLKTLFDNIFRLFWHQKVLAFAVIGGKLALLFFV